MKIPGRGIYHIYNRGNNSQTIFFSERNYFYFLKKCHHYLKPCANILAWCLMPNQFHFLINVTDQSLRPIRSGGILMPAITVLDYFRVLMQKVLIRNRTGNLFQQKTKTRCTSEAENCSLIAFHYIHQAPVIAGLVKNLEDWQYSSFNDYTGLRKGTLCERQNAYELLDLGGIDFYSETIKKIDTELMKQIF